MTADDRVLKPELREKKMKLILNAMREMAFTIEPSVYGPYGVCNIEQDVLVSEDAWVPLSTSQDEIIRIR